MDAPGRSPSKKRTKQDNMTEVVDEIARLSGGDAVFPVDKLPKGLIERFLRAIETDHMTPVAFHRLCTLNRRFKEVCRTLRIWDSLFLMKFVLKRNVPLSAIKFGDHYGDPRYQEWTVGRHLMPDGYGRLAAWIACNQINGNVDELYGVRMLFLKRVRTPVPAYGRVHSCGFRVEWMEPEDTGYDPTLICSPVYTVSQSELARQEAEREEQLKKQWLRENPRGSDDDDEDERRQEMEDWVDGLLREEFQDESGVPETIKSIHNEGLLIHVQREFMTRHGYHMARSFTYTIAPNGAKGGLYDKYLVYQLLQAGFRPDGRLHMMTDPQEFAHCAICSAVSETRCKSCKEPICGKACQDKHLVVTAKVCGKMQGK